MKRPFILLFIFLPVLGFSQTEFGIKGGLNLSDIVITNYINPDVESDFQLKAGLHGGFFVNGMLSDRAGLAAELLYSNKGVRAAGSNINLHYIALPMLIQYGLTDHFLAEIGTEVAYMVSSSSEFGNVANTYNNKLDLGLDAGLRFDTSKMFFGLRYCAGLFSVTDPEEIMGPAGVEKIKYQNRVLQFSVGFKLYTLE